MVDATRCFFCFLGCMVASRGGYQMARGRHYAKLSLSNAARLSFSDLCILLFMFLSLCRLCVCVFLCSHWSLVDVPLIFFCPADHVPDWQPRVLLGMVEARSVNVKKTTTTTTRIQKKRRGTPTNNFKLRKIIWVAFCYSVLRTTLTYKRGGFCSHGRPQDPRFSQGRFNL